MPHDLSNHERSAPTALPLHATHQDTVHRVPSTIAVSGMAVRLPGATTVEELWDLVESGRTTFEPVSPDDARRAGLSDQQLAESAYVPVRSVPSDIDGFDADAFGISARDALLMDPQHRMFLEVARAALDDAGLTQTQGLKIGVFGSTSSSSYLTGPLTESGLWNEHDMSHSVLLANDKDFLCTRVSYVLGLVGPSMTVQTACSSSLVAIDQARKALEGGDCDYAVVGGVSVSIPHLGGYFTRSGSIFSPSGTCRPFDASADGTVKAHGAAAVVLARNDLATPDLVYAQLLASATNNDGSDKVGFSAPSVTRQAEVVRDAIQRSGMAARDIGYVECHGTGTALGDPLEIRALGMARDMAGACALGSIKGNVGHLDAAAGVVGFIKAALVLDRAVVPPIAGLNRPNDLLELGGLTLPTQAAEAPDLVAAGVSSFGMGGTNAHVVLGRAPRRGPRKASCPARPYSRRRFWPETTTTPVTAPLTAPTTASTATTPVLKDLLSVVSDLVMDPLLEADDDLLDSGVDSLTLVDVLAEVKDRWGADLEFADLEQLRTVRSLHHHLFGSPAGTTPDLIPVEPVTAPDIVPALPEVNAVRMGANGGPTIFLVHPAGGTTACYVPMQRALGDTASIVGLSFPRDFLDRGYSLRQLATSYLARVRAIQPHGPYLLGGYSFGGNLAAEMALKLKTAGETVPGLLMFDSHPPHAYTSGNCKDDDYLRAFPTLLTALFPQVAFNGDVHSLPTAHAVLDAVHTPQWSASMKNELATFYQIWCDNHRALKRWTPDQDLDIPVTIAEATRPEPPEILDLLDIAQTSVGEWDRYLTFRARRIPVHGDHYTIVQDETAATELAAITADFIRANLQDQR